MRLWMLSLAMIGVAVSTVSAKTVALWPLENGNTRCAIDPRNDFTPASVTYGDQTIGWNLPPNADSNVTDTANYLFDPVNRSEVKLTTSRSLLDAKSDHLWSLLDLGPGKQLTLEGFFKLSELIPEKIQRTKIIANVNGGTANPSGGWSLNYYSMLTQKVDGVSIETYRIFRLEGNGWQLNFNALTEDEVVSLTNAWNHFAVVYNYQSAVNAGSSDWTIYFNGRPLGTRQRRMSFAPALSYASIRLGHHLSASDDRTAYGQFAYWRLSDRALTPEEFLNYDPEGKGGAIVPVPEPQKERTVAYWKFNATDGVADVRDYVGDAHLVALHANNRGATGASALLVPSEESAFEGNPPNPTVVFPSGNHGSFRGPTTRLANVCVTNNNLGARLDLMNSFTVEGWFKPQRRTGTEYHESLQWMFGNMSSSTYRGWNFGIRTEANGLRRLRIFAVNDHTVDGTRMIVPATTKDQSFCDVTDWGEEWRHLALTYDHTGGAAGCGQWTLYMNGVEQGKVDNVIAMAEAAAKTTAKYFYLGAAYDGGFAGLMDAVRVSGSVLQPNQFLCASGNDAQAATDVIATWPLNVTAGTGLGGANLEGGYYLFPRETDFPEGYYLTKTSEGAPNATIPNPDRSRAFDGDAAARAENVGSVGFCGGNDHDYAWLATNDRTVMNTFAGEDGWTLEGWVNYDTTNGALNWAAHGVLFGLGEDLGQNSMSYRLTVWNKTDYVGRTFYQIGDSFGALTGEPKVTSQVTEKKWYHLAVVHSYYMDESGETPVKMSRLSYYLNGNLQTNMDTVAKATVSTLKWLIFGSNTNGSRGFPGWVNSWRLSRGQLQPSEFLNATAEAPVDPVTEKKTLAYWPIDRREDATLDEDVKAGVAGYVLSAVDTNVYGVVTARARAQVPNPDAVADRTNIGSLVLTNGSVFVDYLGNRLDLNTSWTIEGWIKPTEEFGTVPCRVAGTMSAGYATAGWVLTAAQGVDGPVFGLRAQATNCTPFVEGVFVNATAARTPWQAGNWNHLALSFDPSVGRGQWTLCVNGKLYGTLENTWRNLMFTAQESTFRLGSADEAVQPSFVGGYDMWRVSSGVLAEEDLLYRAPLGMMVIFR